jgi:hypothetical protein
MKDMLSGQVASRGEGDLHKMFWSVNLKERDHMEILGIDGRITLKLKLNKVERCRSQWALMKTVIQLTS